MAEHSILWRRLDLPGHEVARLESRATGWQLTGTSLFSQGEPVRLDYTVALNAAWQTETVQVRGWVGNRGVDIELRADAERRWKRNGQDCPNLSGCVDVDLGFSPATNLLPIRRLNLPVGQDSRVRAAWLSFPDLTMEPLDQMYRRTAQATYRYESGGGNFVANLDVNSTGFVTRYANLWIVEADS
jgi:hypothetical protein